MQTPLSKYPRLHRALNTVLLLTLAGGLFLGYQKLDKYMEEETDRAEIAQLVIDEGYRACSYKDSRGYPTIGFGHLIKKGENFSGCITPQAAVELLRDDYAIAKESVADRYPWAEGDAQRVLINATYQMGENRLAKFKKSLIMESTL